MKFMLVVLMVVTSVVCWGQSVAGQGSGVSAPFSNTVVMQDHPSHATQRSLRTSEDLYEANMVTMAQGERPLSEVSSTSVKTERPLGDIAREFRSLPHVKATVRLEQ